jgi:hypothetical protein
LSPVRISPEIHPSCLPSTAKAIPRGDVWLHEPKLDGYRFQIVKDGRLLPYTAEWCDWTKRLLLLAEALAGIPAGPQRSTPSWSFPLARAGRIFAPCVALIDRRLKLTELVARSSVRAACTWCRGFDNGAKLPWLMFEKR